MKNKILCLSIILIIFMNFSSEICVLDKYLILFYETEKIGYMLFSAPMNNVTTSATISYDKILQ